MVSCHIMIQNGVGIVEANFVDNTLRIGALKYSLTDSQASVLHDNLAAMETVWRDSLNTLLGVGQPLDKLVVETSKVITQLGYTSRKGCRIQEPK